MDRDGARDAPVVFEDLEPDLGPERVRRRVPRPLAVAGGLAAAGVVVAVLVARGGTDRPVAAVASPTPPYAAVSFVPTAARGVVATTTADVDVVVLDRYAVPGVMSVSGRVGWKLDAAGSSADVRRYTALDVTTGRPGATVTFGVADRAPLATVEAETRRHTDGLATAGATGFTSVLSAYEDVMASDLSYTTAGGQFVMERLWLHDGIALFVRVSDVWAESVTRLFDDTVRFGAVTP